MIFSFTHTQEMPWMLPGVAPTNARVEVALVAIVRFQGDKLVHEHIYWDQASVLKQIGLLTDPKLPVCGAESARKVADPRPVSGSVRSAGNYVIKQLLAACPVGGCRAAGARLRAPPELTSSRTGCLTVVALTGARAARCESPWAAGGL